MNTLLIIVTFCTMPSMASKFNNSGMLGPGQVSDLKRACMKNITDCYESKYKIDTNHPDHLKFCLVGPVAPK